MFKWISNLFLKNKSKSNDIKIFENLIDDSNETSIDITVNSIDEFKTLSDIDVQEKLNPTYNLDKRYTVLDTYPELKEQQILYNSPCSYSFKSSVPEGYSLLYEHRIVGCYYRSENIDDVIETFKKLDCLKFDLIVEDDLYNEYDSNAKKVSLVYLVENEIRKMHLGYLSRETAYELDGYDLKSSLIKIENIDYKDTHLAIYLKTEELEKKEQLEKENTLREIKLKAAFEMNQLGMTLEKMGQIDESIEKYKESINLGFDGSHPFDRLNIFYRKSKDYENEIANCKSAIKTFSNNHDKQNKYKTRLERALELNSKQICKEKSATEKTNVKQVNKVKSTICEVSNIVETERICTICHIKKPIGDFEKNGKNSDGNQKYKHQCKKCRNELKKNLSLNK